MDEFAATRKKERELLHADLRNVLGQHGREDALGNGDFWVVDDDYSTPQQKVRITRVSFLTRPVAREIQRVLRGYSLAWEVLLVLDMHDPRIGEADENGVTVHKASIEEHWNAHRMREAFGSEFAWNLSSS